MQQPTWAVFAAFALTSAFGFYLALSTKVQKTSSRDLGQILRWYAKIVGWIIGVGSSLVLLRLLGDLLDSGV